MRKNLLLALFTISTIALLTSGIEDNNGKAGRTGSPGEQTCVTGCHNSYALNSGSGSIALTSDIPVEGYTPGHVYAMHLTVTQSGVSLFGLGLEALTTANANAGTLTPAAGNQIKSATISGVSRKNITHTLNGGSGTSGSHTFNFSWTAPTAGTGNVNFYFIGVAADGNNHNSLDYVYNSSEAFTEYIAPSSVNTVDNLPLELNIYPNPITDKFSLRYSLKDPQQVNLSIYALTGELLQQVNLGHQTTGEHIENIALNSNLVAGVYLLCTKTGNTTSTKRIFVQ